MQHGFELVTAPTEEPLTLQEAKDFLRVDSSTEDAFITMLIVAGRKAIETYIGLKLIAQTWKFFMDEFECNYRGNQWWDGTREGYIGDLTSIREYIEIETLAPIRSITHLKTYDDTDTASTMSSSDYYVDTAKRPGRIYVRQGSSWPTTLLRGGNGIEIQGVFGLSSNAAGVPEDIKLALLQFLMPAYECRGTEMLLPEGAKALLDQYRVVKL